MRRVVLFSSYFRTVLLGYLHFGEGPFNVSVNRGFRFGA